MSRPRLVSSGLFLVCCALPLLLRAQVQRKLEPNQVSQMRTIAVDGADARLVYETGDVIEAPNWTPDGKRLVYNSGGKLWTMAADGSGHLHSISTGAVHMVNNDHVLSPDGRTVYISADGQLYAVPMAGGEPRRISNEFPAKQNFRCFLHGISADGQALAYVGAEQVGDDIWGRLDLYTIPASGGRDVQLTNTAAPDDGPEFSPDGKWIYFNSELNSRESGHAQIYRMRSDGTGIQQLTRDERVNWFPHVSPDGKWLVFMSYPPGTIKHPADKPVILRRIRPDGSEQADIVSFSGGQGTFNVNSWSPDSRHFAYVAYPTRGTAK